MLNCELPSDFTFSRVTRFGCAACEDEVSDSPCLVKRDRLLPESCRILSRWSGISKMISALITYADKRCHCRFHGDPPYVNRLLGRLDSRC